MTSPKTADLLEIASGLTSVSKIQMSYLSSHMTCQRTILLDGLLTCLVSGQTLALSGRTLDSRGWHMPLSLTAKVEVSSLGLVLMERTLLTPFALLCSKLTSNLNVISQN